MQYWMFYICFLYSLTRGTDLWLEKKFDVSTAYAICSGIGIALIAIIGIMVFKKPATLVKVLNFYLRIWVSGTG